MLIDVLRGGRVTERIEEMIQSGDVLATTAINVEEVVRGLRPHELESATHLFDGMVILPMGLSEGWQAGEWRRDYSAKGRTLSQADCLIAAAALTTGAQLLTANVKDFPMPEVKIELLCQATTDASVPSARSPTIMTKFST